jgi:uncharacterized repeat protein (TIGR01451 family)
VIAGAGIAIQIDAGSGNLIQGNYIGVNAAGTAALPASDSLAITGSSGPANVVGGAAAGAGNVLVGSGSIISVQGVGDTLIQGNLIGTNATGTAGLNGGNGIFDTSSGNSMIIGNVLSGLTNLGIAIEIETLGVPTTKVIRGNKIGTDVTGTVSIPNNLHGVFIVVSPGNGSVVGGTAAGEGNIIAFNGGQGVDLLGASSTGWAIVGNSIFSNGGLGISLSNSSVPTPNDSGDADTGANNLQNFPVITSTVPGSGTVAVSGTLNSAASSTFLLEFFASTACDGSGNGEGQTFIGSTQVTTNASGNASFGPLTFVQPAGTSIITATATSNPGNIGVTGAVAKPDTSEFSACLVAPASPPPPAIAKAFAPSSIAVNGTSTLTFTITNTAQGNAALTGVAFTDTLPAGLVVATPNGLSGTCGAGTVTAAAGGGSIALSGGTLAAGGSCTISVNVTATSAGTKTNNTGPITSTESGQGGNASVDLIVTGQATPPTITKSFNPTSIALNGTTTLSFALTNPNASATLNNIGFSDTLPAGLVVATPNGLTGTCGGGTIAATTGSGTVSLSGATIAASGSCTLSVNVTGTTTGTKNNSVQVSSTNGGNGNTANASVTVTAMLLSPATLSKSFGTATLAPGGVTTLSFTLTNPNTSSALTGVGFTDTLPGGLVLSTPNGLSGSCGGGTITAVAGSSSVSLSGATLAGECRLHVHGERDRQRRGTPEQRDQRSNFDRSGQRRCRNGQSGYCSSACRKHSGVAGLGACAARAAAIDLGVSVLRAPWTRLRR